MIQTCIVALGLLAGCRAAPTTREPNPPPAAAAGADRSDPEPSAGVQLRYGSAPQPLHAHVRAALDTEAMVTSGDHASVEFTAEVLLVDHNEDALELRWRVLTIREVQPEAGTKTSELERLRGATVLDRMGRIEPPAEDDQRVGPAQLIQRALLLPELPAQRLDVGDPLVTTTEREVVIAGRPLAVEAEIHYTLLEPRLLEIVVSANGGATVDGHALIATQESTTTLSLGTDGVPHTLTAETRQSYKLDDIDQATLKWSVTAEFSVAEPTR